MGSNSSQRKKIAVLGGGMSSLTSVLELTEAKDWQTHYDITVYQLGWRLGGKGASGRNREQADRIEEHGLHLWFGFYDNAFDLIQKCYQANQRPLGKPLATWEEAFKPHDFIVLETQREGKWEHWPFEFPRNSEQPGLHPDSTPPSIADYVKIIVEWMWEMYKVYRANYGLSAQPPAKERNFLRKIWRQVKGLIQASVVEWGEELLERALENAEKNRGVLHNKFLIEVLKCLDRFIEGLWRDVANKIEGNQGLYRSWIALDFAVAHVRGIIKDGVAEQGFDVINNYDYREWLQRHGASDITLNSGIVKGVYGLVFGGYNFHQDEKPLYTFEAGVALRGALRMMFTYRGAIYYRMQAGMGDTIFAPIYEVLKKRGVKFEFFHKVTNLKPSEDKSHIAAIEITRQVNLKNGEYKPLYNVKDLPCWPSEPFYEQITEGEEIKAKGINLESYYADWEGVEKLTLKHGEDFDLIIQGIAIGAIPHIAQEILAEPTREDWRQMVKHVTACPTQAFQIWLKPDVAGLGWKFWPEDMALMGSYEEPYDTWSDMSDLIIRERWPDAHFPNNISYFCGPMDRLTYPPFSDHGFPEQMTERAKKNALFYMKNLTRHIWPNSQNGTPDNFNWELLLSLQNQSGEQRFGEQFFRANIEPSELYVLSETNSSKYRLKTNETSFENMLFTGDWIDNGFNAGCIEASVIAGKQTARVILGHNRAIPGEQDQV